MLLSLLKRVVKAALHQATDEWALECGLPRAILCLFADNSRQAHPDRCRYVNIGCCKYSHQFQRENRHRDARNVR